MKLTSENKIIIGVVIVTLLILGIGVGIFSKPEAVYTREELIPAGVNTKGNTQAKTFLVEFSDFQCPACKNYHAVIKEIVEKYKDNLLFAYRHFPLQQHNFAMKAALASEAAADQDKFWEMHDYLFANQEKLSDQIIEGGAGEFKLDLTKFKEGMGNGENKGKVSKDMADGSRFGVDSTPTFFLNGKKLRVTGVEDLKNTVAKEIEKSR